MRRKYMSILPIVPVLLACMLGVSGCSEAEVKAEVSSLAETESAVMEESETLESESAVMEETEAVGAEAETPVREEQKAPQALAVSLITTHDYDMNDYITLACYNFTEAALSEKAAERLPELSAALAKYGRERKNAVESAYQLLLENAQKRYEELYNHEREETGEGGYDFAMDPCVLENEILVCRADSAVVSFLEKEVSSGGPASADVVYRGVAFDAETGQRLELSDVITDVSVLPESLSQELAEYGEIPWTLGYDGITFYVGTDAPLAITIGFMEQPEIFEERYTEVPEEYTVCFNKQEILEFNLDGDAELEMLQIRFTDDEWGGFSRALITLDGQEYLDEGYYAYQCRPYLIRANGTHYLYLDGTVENDYRVLRVYELNSEEIRPVETMWSAGVHSYYLSELVFVEELPTNPDSFVLDSRMDALSTANAGRVYHVGSDGLPEAETDYYTLNHEIMLTTKIPLTVDVINPETGEAEAAAEELSAGTRLILYRTDNQTYADLKLEDGRICRVSVDLSNGWPQLVNGRTAEECFDGMIFAG